MFSFRMRKAVAPVLMASTALLGAAPDMALAQSAKASKVQQQQDKMVASIPHCTKRLGTITIVDGDDSNGGTQANLAPPQKLLKVIVQKSGCFGLVDRGDSLRRLVRHQVDPGLQRRQHVERFDGVVKLALPADQFSLQGGVSSDRRQGLSGLLRFPADGLLKGARLGRRRVGGGELIVLGAEIVQKRIGGDDVIAMSCQKNHLPVDFSQVLPHFREARDQRAGDQHMTDRAIYDIVWQCHGRLLRGRALELKGIVLERRHGVTQAALDARWATLKPKS